MYTILKPSNVAKICCGIGKFVRKYKLERKTYLFIAQSFSCFDCILDVDSLTTTTARRSYFSTVFKSSTRFLDSEMQF